MISKFAPGFIWFVPILSLAIDEGLIPDSFERTTRRFRRQRLRAVTLDLRLTRARQMPSMLLDGGGTGLIVTALHYPTQSRISPAARDCVVELVGLEPT